MTQFFVFRLRDFWDQLCRKVFHLLFQDRGNGGSLDSMRSLEQFLPVEGGGGPRVGYGHQDGKG